MKLPDGYPYYVYTKKKLVYVHTAVYILVSFFRCILILCMFYYGYRYNVESLFIVEVLFITNRTRIMLIRLNCLWQFEVSKFKMHESFRCVYSKTFRYSTIALCNQILFRNDVLIVYQTVSQWLWKSTMKSISIFYYRNLLCWNKN